MRCITMIRRQFICRRYRYMLLLSLLLIYCVYYMVSHIPRYPDIYYLSDPVFLDRDKCPACYGNSLCHKFYSGGITFDRYSRFRFLDKFNTKNVHYGLMDNKTQVMIKRLAHDVELSHFDDLICKNATLPKGCNVSSAIYQTAFANNDGQMLVKLLEKVADMTSCPSQRLVDLLLRSTQERKSRFAISLDERLQLISTVMINPETIIMQAFPKTSKNFWPFPEYVGACGRMVVEMYAGPMLDTVYNQGWELRVDVAYQLMKIAERLTDNDIGFALYLTDVSYDNFAIDADGKVVVIDLENIIIVDKARIKREKKPGWDVPIYSESLKCPNRGDCLSFSIEDLCQHYDVDHNYYAVCHNLLSTHAHNWGMPSGILHDLPEAANQRWNITSLVEACADPTIGSSRKKIIQDLILNLEELRRDVF